MCFFPNEPKIGKQEIGVYLEQLESMGVQRAIFILENAPTGPASNVLLAHPAPLPCPDLAATHASPSRPRWPTRARVGEREAPLLPVCGRGNTR